MPIERIRLRVCAREDYIQNMTAEEFCSYMNRTTGCSVLYSARIDDAAAEWGKALDGGA